MCGIAGILRFDGQPIDASPLERMAAQLAHRGPDGHGVYREGPAGLAHTRLAIIDLPGGAQPMIAGPSGSHGPLVVVFNGEIYNHRSLRETLTQRGHVFASDHSDTEVLLHGYRAWGRDLPRHLHGMFALAIWDVQAQQLLLCRDRTGKKPLYYCRRRGPQDELTFGSTVATLAAAAPDGLTLDPQALLHYLRIGYCGQVSLLAGVCEIPPGHVMTVDRGGEIDVQLYWRPPPVSRSSTSLGVMSALEQVLRDAVAARLAADVPLGCFLSGGIDSSVVAALAQQELHKRGGGPLQTFSMRMPDAQYDESPHAQAVADHIGARHRVLDVAMPEDVIGDLERLMALAGEPIADSSLLPTYWLSRAAREHVKVALSGDGGDELFAGYDRYRAMVWLGRHRGWLRHVPLALAPEGHPKSPVTRLGRLLRAARPVHPAQWYMSMVHLFNDAQIAALGAMPDDPAPASPGPLHFPDEPDPGEAAMRWDLVNYLPCDLLRKVDRASMAVALEVRCPLLDTQVCDLAGHLPRRVLMPGWGAGRPKGLLRKLAGTLVPASIARRPKMGFALPLGPWLAGRLHEPLRERLLDGPLVSMGLTSAPIEQMLAEHRSGQRDHTHRLFALLQLSLWESWRCGLGA